MQCGIHLAYGNGANNGNTKVHFKSNGVDGSSPSEDWAHLCKGANDACPAGYTHTIKDVWDNEYNVHNPQFTTIEACAQGCEDKKSCKMFEFRAQPTGYCKLSAGANTWHDNTQDPNWVTCVKPDTQQGAVCSGYHACGGLAHCACGASTGDRTPFSLTISTKDATIDADGVRTHGATNGAPTYFSDDKRYVLDCPQTADEKTVKFTISRPSTYSSFGAEWVQMFPKDSWENVTSEYEPFSFNDYGSKIPLHEFRPQSDACVGGVLESDGVTTCVEGFTLEDNTANTLNVFMEVSVEGDFEIKYGTPQIVSQGTVGDASARWVAHEFKQTLLRVGSPWADCASGATGTVDYGQVGTILPALYGNPSLNIDTYNSLIADLGTPSVPVKVVLQIYGIGADGAGGFRDLDDWTVSGIAANGYTKCYRAGNGCPLDHEVCDATYCNIDRWNQIIAGLRAVSNVEVLGHIETYDGINSVTNPATKRTNDAIVADIEKYNDNFPVDGFYFNQANGGKATVDNLMDIAANNATGFVVFASGEPLFDKSALGHAGNPDVWITLAQDVNNMGIWTPFSWFHDTPTSQWGAIIDSVPAGSITTTATTLFDRGYGWVYLHSADSFGTESTHTVAALDAVEDRSTRRLSVEPEERRLQATSNEAQWGCDDTLFECRPVCLQTTGVTTIKLGDSFCTAAPMDECSCPCYYDAHWTCKDENVICVASMRDEAVVVGDAVCTSRGSPKPELNQFVERVAGICSAREKKPTTRGAWPAQTCIAEWNEVTITEEDDETSASSEDDETTIPEERVEQEDIILESFAAPAFLAAAVLAQI